MKTSDLSWEEYCSIVRMNPSTLVYGIKSVRSMKRVMDKGFTEETNAMRLGTGIHALLLEPDEFEERFVVMPPFNLDKENLRAPKRKDEPIIDRMTDSKQTSYYKAKVAEFHEANQGKCIIDRHQYDTALTCIEAINSRDHFRELVESCEKEVTLTGEIDGVPFKGRVDLLRDGVIADLKTTKDVAQFGRTFFELSYAFKLSIYRELARQNGYDCEVKVIAQETKDDFDNALFVVPSELLDTAMSNVMLVIAQYKQAMETGVWPGWDRGEKEVALEIPRWAQKQMEALDWSNVELSQDVEEESYY